MNNESSRVAVVGIVISNIESSKEVNRILHEYSDWVIGRMGIPYRERQLNIISVAVDAPLDTINELNGKLGQVNDVSVQTAFAKI